MALVKQTLVDSLKSAFSKEHSADEAAELIASAIDAYIKTATVTTAVIGTATPAGVVTGTGTGSIS